MSMPPWLVWPAFVLVVLGLGILLQAWARLAAYWAHYPREVTVGLGRQSMLGVVLFALGGLLFVVLWLSQGVF